MSIVSDFWTTLVVKSSFVWEQLPFKLCTIVCTKSEESCVDKYFILIKNMSAF